VDAGNGGGSVSHDPQSPTDAADFYDDDFEENDGGYEDGEYEDCGLMPDGQCSKAGSEECDWSCGALHAGLTK
jgi:hypothetical protein